MPEIRRRLALTPKNMIPVRKGNIIADWMIAQMIPLGPFCMALDMMISMMQFSIPERK